MISNFLRCKVSNKFPNNEIFKQLKCENLLSMPVFSLSDSYLGPNQPQMAPIGHFRPRRDGAPGAPLGGYKQKRCRGKLDGGVGEGDSRFKLIQGAIDGCGGIPGRPKNGGRPWWAAPVGWRVAALYVGAVVATACGIRCYFWGVGASSGTPDAGSDAVKRRTDGAGM